ncbi:MAG: molybdopterin dinucleotide binding domain-containing protein [Candidatus Bathyarchaeota archaeon]
MSEPESFVGLCKDCDHDECHVKIQVKEGKIIGVKPLPESFMQPSFGIEGCARAQSFPEIHSHPKRLRQPLKRKGERGQNSWEPISYNQAFDEIAEKLKTIREKYGAETLAIIPTWINEIAITARFANLFGTPNIEGPWRVCMNPEEWMQEKIYGGACHGASTHKCKLAVVWAGRHWVSSGIKWRVTKDIEKLIIIDPLKTPIAEEADFHLQLRPGTDGALALAWLNVIINEELYDKDFVKNWTIGFDRLKERVQEYPPEKVSEITGPSKNDITDSARMYATTKPAAIVWGTGTGHIGRNMGDCEHAKCCLRAITGNLMKDGGNVFRRIHPITCRWGPFELNSALPENQLKKGLGGDRHRIFGWPAWKMLPTTIWARCPPFPHIIHAARTGQPYPIKAMIIESNVLLGMAHTKNIYDALKNLELHVNTDLFMTPTGLLADYVLPVTDWASKPEMGHLEWSDFCPSGVRIFPKGALLDDYDIFRELGIRLGQKAYWPWKSLEEVYDWLLEPSGVDWQEFSKEFMHQVPLKHLEYEKVGFATPSGKVELSSSILEKLGYDSLPRYEEPWESPVRNPELAKEYPYIMISAWRTRPFLHSQQRMIKSLREIQPFPVVNIHPETAKKQGIADGDWVWIESKRGKVKQKCEYFEGMDPQVIRADYGWWYPEMPAEEPSLYGLWESNINIVTDDDFDSLCPKMGTWSTGALCKICKVEEKDIPPALKQLTL